MLNGNRGVASLPYDKGTHYMNLDKCATKHVARQGFGSQNVIK